MQVLFPRICDKKYHSAGMFTSNKINVSSKCHCIFLSQYSLGQSSIKLEGWQKWTLTTSTTSRNSFSPLLSIGRPNNLTIVNYLANTSQQSDEDLRKNTRIHLKRCLSTILKAKYIPSLWKSRVPTLYRLGNTLLLLHNRILENCSLYKIMIINEYLTHTWNLSEKDIYLFLQLSIYYAPIMGPKLYYILL